MAKIGRNTLCPCGSGRKYKHCCLRRDKRAREAHAQEQEQGIAIAVSNISHAQEFARNTSVDEVLTMRAPISEDKEEES